MARERTSDLILKLAAKAIDGCFEYAAAFVDQKGYKKGDYNWGLADDISRDAARKAAKRLEEKGCLEKINKDNKVYYRITERGRNKLEKFVFDREIWDRKWRIVVFDIPEEKKKLRESLRRTLRSVGFKQLQKSVWISPFDVLTEVEKLVDDHDLHQCMWYFLSDSMKNDDLIIELFLNKDTQ